MGVSFRVLFVLETGEGGGKGDGWYAVTPCGAVKHEHFAREGLVRVPWEAMCRDLLCFAWGWIRATVLGGCALCAGSDLVPSGAPSLWSVCAALPCACRMGLDRFSDLGCAALQRLLEDSCVCV